MDPVPRPQAPHTRAASDTIAAPAVHAVRPSEWAALAALLALAVGGGSAALPKDKQAVLDWRNDKAGSITNGMTLAEVKSRWGAPTAGLGCTPSKCVWGSGNGLAALAKEHVWLTFDGGFRVTGFVVEAGSGGAATRYSKPGGSLNSFQTPEGVRLGTPHAKAVSVYGSGSLPGQLAKKSACRARADGLTECKVIVMGDSKILDVVAHPQHGVVRMSYHS